MIVINKKYVIVIHKNYVIVVIHKITSLFLIKNLRHFCVTREVHTWKNQGGWYSFW